MKNIIIPVFDTTSLNSLRDQGTGRAWLCCGGAWGAMDSHNRVNRPMTPICEYAYSGTPTEEGISGSGSLASLAARILSANNPAWGKMSHLSRSNKGSSFRIPFSSRLFALASITVHDVSSFLAWRSIALADT